MILRTLGGLSLEESSEILEVKTKPLLLLCYLAIDGDKTTRDLLGTLFADENTVYTNIKRVRDLISEDVIITKSRQNGFRDEGYKANLELLDVDVLGFRSNLEKGYWQCVKEYQSHQTKPFLHNVKLTGCSKDFENWVLKQRETIKKEVEYAELLFAAENEINKNKNFTEAANLANKAYGLGTEMTNEALKTIYLMLLTSDKNDLVKNVQRKLKGSYPDLSSLEAKEEIKKLITKHLKQSDTLNSKDSSPSIWQSRFAKISFAALLLTILGLFVMPVTGGLLAKRAEMLNSQGINLLKEKDEEGNSILKEKNKELALQKFKSALWHLRFSCRREAREGSNNFSVVNILSLTCGPDTTTHYNLGRTLYQLGQPEKAIKHFEQAIDIDEHMYLAYNEKARILIQGEKIKDALVVLNKAFEFIKGDYQTDLESKGHFLVSLLITRGWAHFELDQLNNAEDDFKSASDKDNEAAAPYCWLAQVYIEQNKEEEAKAEAHKCIALKTVDQDVDAFLLSAAREILKS